ncbi:hypothetical protein IFR05_006914 [Cadophora sp. M221]|nr:hypothetical protein IFR05_006914 [Cadophora sp. M221]
MSRNASDVSEARQQPPLPSITDHDSSESLPGTTLSSMTSTSSSDYQPPSQGGQDMLTERLLRDYNSSTMSGVVHGNSQVDITQMRTDQPELMHIHHSYDDKTSPFDQFSGDNLESWYNTDDSHMQRTGLGSPYFQHTTESLPLDHSEFSKNESLPQHAENSGLSGYQEHKSQHLSTYDKRAGGLLGIFVEVCLVA